MATINKERIKFGPKYKPQKTENYRYYSSFYNRQEWKDIRKFYQQEHPICEICESHGRIVPVEHVHHIIPFTRGSDERQKERLFLNEGNLMSVCKTCHKLLHFNDDGTSPLNRLSDKQYNAGHQTQFLK